MAPFLTGADNRILQKKRDANRRVRHLAKMDASSDKIQIKQGGYYYIIPVSSALAKKDASAQKVLLIPEGCKNYASSCKEGLDLQANQLCLVSYVFNSCFLWHKICRLLQAQVSSKIGNYHHLFQLESQSDHLQTQFGEVIFVSVANFFDQTMNMQSFELTGNLRAVFA